MQKYLKFHTSDSQFVLWFQLSKKLFSFESDILFGCIYIPPENSKYSTKEAFEELENEMIDISKKEKCFVSLIGDFNAKTGSLSDFIVPDESIVSLFDLDCDTDILDYLYDFEFLTQNDIPLQRVSKCANRPNNYGHKLLELCKRNNLYIANSRIGLDKNVGERTCSDSSVVDYLILSSKLFPFIDSFRVEEFVSLFSDCHSFIKFSILIVNDSHSQYDKGEKREHAKKRWNDEKREQFVTLVHNDPNGALTCIMSKLEEMSVNDNMQTNQQQINDIVSDIGKIFINAANDTFGKTGVKSKFYKHANSKPYFNRKCSVSRKKFHKARKRYSFLKNAENRRKLREASKGYKATLNKAYIDYQHKTANKLRDMSKKDPKSLWKILNSLNKVKSKTEVNEDISLQALYEHFKKLNESDFENDVEINLDSDNIFEDVDLFLNCPITEEEIKKVISKLKNGKAFGADEILNEYIKNTADDLMPIYIKLFNLILDTGIVPESWLTGIMVTIYKNKGSKSDPEMYRGITLNSCFSKTFSAIINDRLNSYAEHIDLITKAQAGFRRGFSTVDNIFVLYSLITIYFSLGKKLYCTFVDFKSAFDTVWRTGLWQKMQKSNIKGKLFRVIYNMYQNIKTCVRMGNDISEFFISTIGVKQGENLSPFLFSLFLNDLEDFFVENDVESLSKISELCHESIQMYVKLFIILYADDTALLSETIEGMKETLLCFEQYCERWRLKVNTSKTKVVVFSKRKVKLNDTFKLYGENIEIVDSYGYLGIIFNYNGSFKTGKKKLFDQAQKSLYCLYKKIQNICIPIDLQLKLFDSLVSPILTYSSEVWGFENKDSLERLHLQFCKTILKVRNSTPNYMVYGELGRFPLEIIIKRKMIMFWNSLQTEKTKLSSIMYQVMLKLHSENPSKFKWVSYVKSVFDDCGLSFIWEDQIPIEKNTLKTLISTQLNDQFIQLWFSQMNDSSRGMFYSKYKINFGLENYLVRLNQRDRIYLAKLRCSNLKIPIETGRWSGIPINERICHICQNGIGDEFHYLFICPNQEIKSLREKFIPTYYINNPNEYKLTNLLRFCHTELYRNLATFIRILPRYL